MDRQNMNVNPHALQTPIIKEGDPILAQINELIELNRDAAKLYEAAGKAFTDDQPTNAELANEFAARRRDMAAELTEIIVSKGEEPETSGSFRGLIQRVWLKLRDMVDDDAGPIFAQCADGDNVLIDAYAEAVAKPEMPDHVRQMLREHLSHLRAAHARISGLAAALAS